MSSPAVQQDVAEEVDIDAVVRSARASVALLALQVRTALYEAETGERSPTDDGTAAKALLQASLDKMINKRRLELERDLEEERGAAARAVLQARHEAAAIVAAGERAARELADERRAAATLAEERHVAAAAVAGTPPAALPEPVTLPPPSEPATAGAPSPEYLAQVVHAAVSATLSRVGAAGLAAGPMTAAVPTTYRIVRPPLRRRLLHVDVVLPMILVLVVLIVLLAWVG